MDKTNNIDMEPHLKELVEESAALFEDVKKVEVKMQSYYPTMLREGEAEKIDEEVKRNAQLLDEAGDAMSKSASALFRMSDEIKARWKDIRKSGKKIGGFSVPANAAIDVAEQAGNHFAKGLNYNKLFLICFIGSFLGVVVETIFVLVSKGILMNRTGLVYGPFNLLYGAGAVVLTIALYQFRNRSGWISVLGGMIVGSALEYACSWAQEMILGSRSWDYSHVPFNLNGRISLLYAFFWGILGGFWIKNLYPLMTTCILKIPNKVGRIAVKVLTVFMVINIVVSCVAVFRWSQRREGVPANNAVWELMDERFPDERMERIYPSMKFGK